MIALKGNRIVADGPILRNTDGFKCERMELSYNDVRALQALLAHDPQGMADTLAALASRFCGSRGAALVPSIAPGVARRKKDSLFPPL